jgi:survival motor neuron protein
LKTEHEDIWDDTLLIKAYEESVRLHKEDVAKQVAMKTNKKQNSEEDETESSGTSSVEEFKVGDFVRSTFAEDGVDYEAEIVAMTENGTCTICYIGYGNQERVKAEDLVASWGPEAREEQRILAEADQQATTDNHHEDLHQFVMNKSQGVRNSLPIPPMVSNFLINKNNPSQNYAKITVLH